MQGYTAKGSPTKSLLAHLKTKRYIALICVVVLCMSSVGASLYAYGDEQSSSTALDAPEFNKQIRLNDDGSYTLSMNVVGKSNEVSEQQVDPLDIALVLDVSGSMDDASGSGVTVTTYSKISPSNMNAYSTYYVRNGDQYDSVTCAKAQRVSYRTQCTVWQSQNQSYTINYGYGYWSSTTVTPNTTFYSASTHEETRMDALHSSVDSFLESLEEQNAKISNANSKIQVSLIKYAGTKTQSVGNNTYSSGGYYNSYTYNYSQIVDPLTSDINEVQSSVEDLEPGGATHSDYGFELAKTALAQDSRANAKKIVIFYSDGEPTSGSKFEPAVANSAIQDAYALKQSGVTVFSIGAMANANASATDQVNEFMNYVSSNYPSAQSTAAPGSRAGGDYYKAVTTGTDLQSIFSDLIHEVTSGTAYDHVAMTDTLSQYAQFTEPTQPNFGAQLVVRNAQGDEVPASAVGLPDAQGKTYTITSDPATKTVAIQFPAEYSLRNGYSYALEYKIEPTQLAYDEHASNVNASKPEYNNVQGDEGTGEISEFQDGFRSNKQATLTYTPRVDGESEDEVQEVPMPHPVIQVVDEQTATLTVRKQWLGKEAKPDSITVDIACTEDDGSACDGYSDVTITPNEQGEWTRDIEIPQADMSRTFTVTEDSVDGYSTVYDDAQTWKLAAHTVGTHSTTITNYPKSAPLNLGNIQLGKTVQGADVKSDFTFTLNAGEQEGLQFTPTTAVIAGPYTQGEQKTGAFAGTAQVALPDAQDSAGRSYDFEVREQKPDSSAWDWDQDAVTVHATITRDDAGVPQFNDDGTVQATMTYDYADDDADHVAANQQRAAFTNKVKSVSKLPLTGEGGATPLLWLVVGGGFAALAMLTAGGVALWRKRHLI